jgi:hypothetical protein
MLLVILILKTKSEGDDENEDDKGLEKKIANLFRSGAEMIRVDFFFIFSFAASQGCVKGTNFQFNSRRPGDFYASWSGA